MDKFKLEFKTSGAAFDTEAGGDPEYETVRILEAVAASIRNGDTNDIIWDINGNRIGEWSLS